MVTLDVRPKDEAETTVEALESVDMGTVVLIGNCTSFMDRGHMVTPRGYEVKQAP